MGSFNSKPANAPAPAAAAAAPTGMNARRNMAPMLMAQPVQTPAYSGNSRVAMGGKRSRRSTKKRKGRKGSRRS
jgi:hypothetical protein